MEIKSDKEMVERKQDWFFTFGVNHPLFRKKYVKLHGTCDETRDIMIECFGKKWAMQYLSLEKVNPNKWGLTEMEVDILETMPCVQSIVS